MNTTITHMKNFPKKNLIALTNNEKDSLREMIKIIKDNLNYKGCGEIRYKFEDLNDNDYIFLGWIKGGLGVNGYEIRGIRRNNGELKIKFYKRNEGKGNAPFVSFLTIFLSSPIWKEELIKGIKPLIDN